MKKQKKIAAIILSLIMILTMMPAMAFAEDTAEAPEAAPENLLLEETFAEGDPAVQHEEELAAETTEEAAAEITEDEITGDSGEAVNDAVEVNEEDAEEIVDPAEDEEGDEEADDESDMGYEDLSFSAGLDPEGTQGVDSAQLMEEFLYSDKPQAEGRETPPVLLSVKGDRLTGNNLRYYNQMKSMINEVNALKRSSTFKTVSVNSFLGKRKFTASQLGVRKIGYKKNGKWYVSNAAKKKLMAMLNPEDWKKTYQSLMADTSNTSYWVNWGPDYKFYEWNCPYRFNGKTLIFDSSGWIAFSLPVIPEFGLDAGSSTSQYIYKVSLAKIRSANTAKTNARNIVKTFDDAIPTEFAGYSNEAIDFYRLWYYCRVIALYTEYDDDAYQASLKNTVYWRGPWSLISVLDGNDSTLSVCTGYAKAFKYLCDLSTFKSPWIDCQVVTGDAGGGHMWNIVRMNDGLNYLVDPTWADEGETANSAWFLRGDPTGTANRFTIEGSTRTYDAWTISVFPPAERILSRNSYYKGGFDRKIVLPGTRIKKLTKKKKAFNVRWNPVTATVGALYVDGYQIQYSTKKSMKGAKNVYVKGFAQSSKLIKKLKKNKKYYVRIRTYAKVGKGTYYSAWSAKKKVKTKK